MCISLKIHQDGKFDRNDNVQIFFYKFFKIKRINPNILNAFKQKYLSVEFVFLKCACVTIQLCLLNRRHIFVSV